MSKKAETAGAKYASAQLESDYFMDWVRDQLFEASRMPPEKVLPLETMADAEVIAKNMLQQLEWDTQRDVDRGVLPKTQKEAIAFWRGFAERLRSAKKWLAEEVLYINQANRGEYQRPRTHKPSRAREVRAVNSDDAWVPPELAGEGITPRMLTLLMNGMGEHGGAQVPRPGDSVVWDRAYSDLRDQGYIVLKRKTEGLSSLGDYFVLTDKGAAVLNKRRETMRRLAGPGAEPGPSRARKSSRPKAPRSSKR